MVTEKEVMGALSEVMDPELGISLVDLGLIYGVDVAGEKVGVKMTFTTPACPMVHFLVSSVEDAVKKVEGVSDVEVQLVWDPPWTPDKMSDEGKEKLGLK
ncbi:MAG: metal-sulfur cluster assembly factor [bacterium]|nr:metal-sulfur cluster assembly factor [bacterium]